MYWVPDPFRASLSVQDTIQKALRMVDESSLGFDPIRYLLPTRVEHNPHVQNSG